MKGDLFREKSAIAHFDDPIGHGRPFLAVGDQDDSFSLLLP
jgi:hypothetical protein